ncbi:MAG: tyrosine-protein phosphatase [Clostridia bacterium]|nr:tyrosine-protein phosphatase [Clostridia bacterium]
MKKWLAFILAFCMVFCVCGCQNEPDNASSQETEVEYQQIIVDESDNEITSSFPTVSSEESPSSEDTTVSSNVENSNTSTVTSSTQPNYIDYNKVVEVDICDDIIRGYLDSPTPERQYAMLSEYSTSKLDYQRVELDWRLDGSAMYTITVSENADFSNSYTIQSKFMTVDSGIFVPGKTYYWKATGTITNEVLGGGKIHIKDAPVRWIKADGTGNMRYMGGWKTESGKTVKYEMMYRGQKIDNLTTSGIETFKQLGMKTELDLRYADQKMQREGTGMNYVFLETSAQYDYIFGSSYANEVKANYKKIFELLSNESNYPFYTHCSAGADRTGTFAFITNGLLGVSYEDLTRDFELTSFSSSGKRWRGNGNGGTFTQGDDQMDVEGNHVAWGVLYNKMMEYGQKNGCTTLSQSIEYFLTSYVGVPKSQIDSFKSIMLE